VEDQEIDAEAGSRNFKEIYRKDPELRGVGQSSQWEGHSLGSGSEYGERGRQVKGGSRSSKKE